jgi:hypothetical protein
MGKMWREKIGRPTQSPLHWTRARRQNVETRGFLFDAHGKNDRVGFTIGGCGFPRSELRLGENYLVREWVWTWTNRRPLLQYGH